MKILIISNSLPYPPYDGSRLILFNLLKHLSSRHQIDLITFLDQPEHSAYENKISRFCDNLYTISAKQQHTLFDKAFYYLSLWPYIVVKKFSKVMNEMVKQRVQKDKYDVIHFDGLGMLPYGLDIRTVPKIAFVIDAVSLYFRRNIIREKQFRKKLLYLIEFLKMKRYEKTIYKQFEKCIVVSDVDKIALEAHCTNCRINVIPNGIDIEYFKPAYGQEDSPSLLFTGNMDFPPNVHAIVWFVQKVFPKIQKVFPDIKLYIVGRNPSPDLSELKTGNGIIITGFVEDIRPYFDRATVYVCPMVSGTGIKNKLLEAGAMGKAIVATSLSIQGIPGIEKERCLMIADNASQFSDRIIELLRNRNHRRKFELDSRKFVTQNHSWSNSVDLMEQIYKEAVFDFSANNEKQY